MLSILAHRTRTAVLLSAVIAVSGALTFVPPAPLSAASFQIQPVTALLDVGQSLQLRTVNDKGGVRWSSSNAGVATVSTTGLLSGKAAGSATIRATSHKLSAAAAVQVILHIPLVAPTITASPGNQTIASGATATMSVSISGTQPITYQWYIGTSGVTTTPIGGATSSSYTTGALTVTANYWVRVTNAFGAANSTTAVITVTGGAGTTYYVSPSGSDSNSCATATSTTPANEKLTVSAGVTCASAGDVVYIRAGTYTGSLNVIDSQTYTITTGTSGSPITVSAYPGDTVTIQPPANVSGIRFATNTVNYMTVQDLIIDMSNSTAGAHLGGSSGIYISDGQHNIFQRLEVKNNAANGIQTSHTHSNADHNSFLHLSSHDNGSDSSAGNSGYGFYLGTSDLLVDAVDVYNNHGYGIQFTGSTGGGNTVRNSKIHDNSCWNAAGGTSGGGVNFGSVTLGEIDNYLIYNNLIYHNGWNAGTAGTGILVYNNTRTTGIYNNTVYNNNGLGIMVQYEATGNVISNNISYGNVGAGTGNNNLWDYGGGSGSPTTDHNLCNSSCDVNGDPLFTNAGAADFTLQGGSPGIDAGTSHAGTFTTDYAGTTRPVGGAWDIGAYER